MLHLYVELPAAVGKFAADKSGVTAIEYVLIAGGIAVAIVVSVGLLGTDLGLLFGDLQVKLAGM